MNRVLKQIEITNQRILSAQQALADQKQTIKKFLKKKAWIYCLLPLGVGVFFLSSRIKPHHWLPRNIMELGRLKLMKIIEENIAKLFRQHSSTTKPTDKSDKKDST